MLPLLRCLIYRQDIIESLENVNSLCGLGVESKLTQMTKTSRTAGNTATRHLLPYWSELQLCFMTLINNKCSLNSAGDVRSFYTLSSFCFSFYRLKMTQVNSSTLRWTFPTGLLVHPTAPPAVEMGTLFTLTFGLKQALIGATSQMIHIFILL